MWTLRFIFWRFFVFKPQGQHAAGLQVPKLAIQHNFWPHTLPFLLARGGVMSEPQVAQCQSMRAVGFSSAHVTNTEAVLHEVAYVAAALGTAPLFSLRFPLPDTAIKSRHSTVMAPQLKK